MARGLLIGAVQLSIVGAFMAWFGAFVPMWLTLRTEAEQDMCFQGWGIFTMEGYWGKDLPAISMSCASDRGHAFVSTSRAYCGDSPLYERLNDRDPLDYVSGMCHSTNQAKITSVLAGAFATLTSILGVYMEVRPPPRSLTSAVAGSACFMATFSVVCSVATVWIMVASPLFSRAHNDALSAMQVGLPYNGYSCQLQTPLHNILTALSPAPLKCLFPGPAFAAQVLHWILMGLAMFFYGLLARDSMRFSAVNVAAEDQAMGFLSSVSSPVDLPFFRRSSIATPALSAYPDSDSESEISPGTTTTTVASVNRGEAYTSPGGSRVTSSSRTSRVYSMHGFLIRRFVYMTSFRKYAIVVGSPFILILVSALTWAGFVLFGTQIIVLLKIKIAPTPKSNQLFQEGSMLMEPSSLLLQHTPILSMLQDSLLNRTLGDVGAREPLVGALLPVRTYLRDTVNVFNFSPMTSLNFFWAGEAYFIAIAVGVAIFLLPISKVALWIWLWYVPTNEVLRGRILTYMDFIGKYSLATLFVVGLMGTGVGVKRNLVFPYFLFPPGLIESKHSLIVEIRAGLSVGDNAGSWLFVVHVLMQLLIGQFCLTLHGYGVIWEEERRALVAYERSLKAQQHPNAASSTRLLVGPLQGTPVLLSTPATSASGPRGEGQASSFMGMAQKLTQQRSSGGGEETAGTSHSARQQSSDRHEDRNLYLPSRPMMMRAIESFGELANLDAYRPVGAAVAGESRESASRRRREEETELPRSARGGLRRAGGRNATRTTTFADPRDAMIQALDQFGSHGDLVGLAFGPGGSGIMRNHRAATTPPLQGLSAATSREDSSSHPPEQHHRQNPLNEILDPPEDPRPVGGSVSPPIATTGLHLPPPPHQRNVSTSSSQRARRSGSERRAHPRIEAMCDRVHQPERGIRLRWTPFGKSVIWAVLFLLGVLTLSCQTMTLFEAEHLGFFGDFITAPKDKVKYYSIWTTFWEIMSVGYESEQIKAYEFSILFFFFVSVVPVVRLLGLVYLWAIPFTVSQQKRAFDWLELAGAWASLDVFWVCLTAMAFYIEDLTRNLTGTITPKIVELLDFLLPWESGFIVTRISLKTGFYVLAMTVVIEKLVYYVLIEQAVQAISERQVERLLRSWASSSGGKRRRASSMERLASTSMRSARDFEDLGTSGGGVIPPTGAGPRPAYRRASIDDLDIRTPSEHVFEDAVEGLLETQAALVFSPASRYMSTFMPAKIYAGLPRKFWASWGVYFGLLGDADTVERFGAASPASNTVSEEYSGFPSPEPWRMDVHMSPLLQHQHPASWPLDEEAAEEEEEERRSPYARGGGETMEDRVNAAGGGI